MNPRDMQMSCERETRQHLAGLQNELAINARNIGQLVEGKPDQIRVRLAERLLQIAAKSAPELYKMKEVFEEESMKIVTLDPSLVRIKALVSGIVTFAGTLEEVRAELKSLTAQPTSLLKSETR